MPKMGYAVSRLIWTSVFLLLALSPLQRRWRLHLDAILGIHHIIVLCFSIPALRGGGPMDAVPSIWDPGGPWSQYLEWL